MITLILKRIRYRELLLLAVAITYMLAGPAMAHAQQSLLVDENGDGMVRMLAFGDSITFGVGDGEPPGAQVEQSPFTDGSGGYPARLQSLGGFPVQNAGVPGEQFVFSGVDRLPGVVFQSNADFVVLFEGNNDAFNETSGGAYGVQLQRGINVVRAAGKTPVLVALYPTCCNHAPEAGFISGINDAIRALASVNNLAVVDLSHAWETTCDKLPECFLLNLPEGLHPNSVGYDVIAQTMLATLAGIDIFAPDGAANLESAFNLAPGTVIVKPDATPTPAPTASGAESRIV